jgi:hypothetical protein
MLMNGVGYWVRFPDTATVHITGLPVSIDSIPVSEGWNLIGSISQSLPVSQVMSIPRGMVTSQFFGYQGSYMISGAIDPGQAYWVKVNQSGMLVLASSASNVPQAAGNITIRAIAEQPPPPPGETSLPADLPKQFALAQNYPNPFNPSAHIQYALPSDSRVSLKIYNVLGQFVATLSNGIETAGYKQVEWNASSFASGIYFYRLEATSVSELSKTFTSVKKMLLMK